MSVITVSLFGGGAMKIASHTSPPLFSLGDVTPAVLAHGLARVNRFSGQAPKPFSVAEHSVNLAGWLGALGYGKDYQRYALIHDGPECLGFGDPHGQVKWAFGSGMRLAEGDLLEALWYYMGKPTPGVAPNLVIAEYDHLIGNYEGSQFGFDMDVSDPRLTPPAVMPPAVQFWCPELATKRWLRAWEKANES